MKSRKSWLVGAGPKTAFPSDWAHILSPIIGRSANEIHTHGLNAGDFSSDNPDVQITFADGSTALFHYAFFVIDEDLGRVGVFTEHCGYWDLPAWSLRVAAGSKLFIGPDD